MNTAPIDIDALITDGRDPKLDYEKRFTTRVMLADTLESTVTELDRARECIEKVRTLVDNPKDAHYPILIRGDVHDILAAYDKGSSDV